MIPKFRVWNKTNKEMVNIDSINFNYGVFESIVYNITCLLGEDEIELMQYTGLFDGNGQEIFEGDILTDEGSELDEFWSYVYVVFKDGMWYCTTTQVEGYSGPLNEFNEYYYVIGNIYQNTDLMRLTDD